ncbi:MAG TPA: hypothetical protein VMN56_12035 [Casimicrobiaceae bacterium]|nr:hypothetical protein [Casimicrobiaceae bacterium]
MAHARHRVSHGTPTCSTAALTLVLAVLAGGLAMPAAAAEQTASVAIFDAAQGDRQAWTAERGTMTSADGKVVVRPDANRRVVLVSPPALPETVHGAGEFVIGVSGTGLLRVRVQGRRDARAGWVTLADARGDALRETPDGIAVKRTLMQGAAAYERLRIEMEFRTTNPRTLERVLVVPAP